MKRYSSYRHFTVIISRSSRSPQHQHRYIYVDDREVIIWQILFQRDPMCSKLCTGTWPTVKKQPEHTWLGWSCLPCCTHINANTVRRWWWWCHVGSMWVSCSLWVSCISWVSCDLPWWLLIVLFSPSHWCHPHHFSHYKAATEVLWIYQI